MSSCPIVAVDIDHLLGARTLTEELFARPSHLKVFVSSQMRGSAFVAERVAVAEAIDATAFARAWYWERDAFAGPYCSEEVCVATAATADGLVLLLGEELTEITRAEFEVARRRFVPVYIFVDERKEQNAEVESFIADVRSSGETKAITKRFANISELKGHVTDALRHHAVQAVRRANFAAAQTNRARQT
jgi:hypothetical protein